jgi:hypothetical protein
MVLRRRDGLVALLAAGADEALVVLEPLELLETPVLVGVEARRCRGRRCTGRERGQARRRRRWLAGRLILGHVRHHAACGDLVQQRRYR